MKIAIFGSRHQEGYLEKVELLLESLTSIGNDFGVMVEERFYNYIFDKIRVPGNVEVFTRLEEAPGLALSIGGDGTFLRVAKIVGRFESPVMGINTGHLGYLSAASIDDVEAIVSDIVMRNFKVEPRSVLRVRCDGEGFQGSRYALNEVAILRRDTASMINVCAVYCGQPLAEYRGDGLIISTPTGSTGYNLSAGGPLVAPEASCWVVSPIAPHALNMRPLVLVDKNAEMLLSCEARSESYMLSLDGKDTVMPIATRLVLDRAPWRVNLVRRCNQSFISTIRNKLGWNS